MDNVRCKTDPEIQDGGRQTGCTYNSEICKTCFNFADACHLMCTTSNVKCSIVDFTTVAYVIQPPYFLGPGNQRNHRRPIMLCYTNHIMTGNSKSTVNIYSLLLFDEISLSVIYLGNRQYLYS
jgi:hypothetical protein